MAYDEELADRVRKVLRGRKGVVERKMFGGLAIMLQGHMACGVLQGDLVVRVGPEAYKEALKSPHARVMDFTGRPMRGFVVVDADGTLSDGDLEDWIARGVTFARSLPPK